MSKVEARNKEIVMKSKAGVSHDELVAEYKISLSNINSIVEKYYEFKNYCKHMEYLKSKNQITEETKLFDLAKLLEFDTRSINALYHKNIRSIEELVVLNDDDIHAIRNVGKLTKQHVEKCIDYYKNNNILDPYVDENTILQHFNASVGLHILKPKEETEEEYINEWYPCCECRKIQQVKANRDYIWKLINLVDEGQISWNFLKKELNKEFDKIEKVNEQLE